MTRLARRNKTRCIKLMRKRGLVFRRGRFWAHCWKPIVATIVKIEPSFRQVPLTISELPLTVHNVLAQRGGLTCLG